MAAVEGAAALLEASLAIIAEHAATDLQSAAEVRAAMGSLLQQLLGLQWLEPKLIFHYVRYLESFGKLVGKVQLDAGPAVASRLFGLLEVLPVSHAIGSGPDDGWKSIYQTRQKVCSGVLGFSKSGAPALAAHLTAVGEQVERLSAAGHLRLMERSALCEAMVLVASAAGSPAQTAAVVEWVLAQTRARWVEPAYAATFQVCASHLRLHEGRQAPWESAERRSPHTGVFYPPKTHSIDVFRLSGL
jgi:hypothetical protein